MVINLKAIRLERPCPAVDCYVSLIYLSLVGLWSGHIPTAANVDAVEMFWGGNSQPIDEALGTWEDPPQGGLTDYLMWAAGIRQMQDAQD